MARLAASSRGRPGRGHRLDRSQRNGHRRRPTAGSAGSVGPTAGGAPDGPLGTKSFWRTRAKARTAPIKDTTDPMTISSLNVLEKAMR